MLRKNSEIGMEIEESIPQRLKPKLALFALIAGDKSPAYRPNEFFRSLFSPAGFEPKHSDRSKS
jgi:hypothetical protein